MRATHGKVFCMPEERAEGSRQDLAYLGAVPLFVNRKYYVRFLDLKLREEGHANLLEDCIFVILSSLEMIASIRAHAIITLLIIYPMRFLAGANALDDWSPFSMAGVADVIEQTLEKAAADGLTLLQPVNIFDEYARKQPKFRECVCARDSLNPNILSHHHHVTEHKTNPNTAPEPRSSTCLVHAYRCLPPPG